MFVHVRACCEDIRNKNKFFIYISLSTSFSHSYLDGLVSSSDESDKEREHHVNEQRDECVKVNLQKNSVFSALNSVAFVMYVLV